MQTHSIERNNSRTRYVALTLAVLLHIGLAIGLYLETNKKPERSKIPVALEQKQTAPKPKASNLP